VKYLVRYAVNLHGSREVEACSAREAFRAVRRACVEDLDLGSFGEPVVFAVEPDDGFDIVALTADEPETAPASASRRRRRHLRLV
jgi:hypothetical protein